MEKTPLNTSDPAAIPVLDQASVSLVREHVRSEATEHGLTHEISETLALLASELATNQLVHARHGEFSVRRIIRETIPGLELIARDQGRGLTDPARALSGGMSTAGSLGNGLAACRRLADEIDVDVRIEEGTTISVRKFAALLSRRSEVGIMSRPFPGERISGDDACFERIGESMVAAVADGLGHGPDARVASRAAIAAVRAAVTKSLADVMREADVAVTGTRGVTMALVRVDKIGGALEHAGVGDVETHIYRPREGERLPSVAGVLSSTPTARTQTQTQTTRVLQGDLVILFSDGVSGRIDLSEELALLREHPIVVAQTLIDRFAGPNDDALVFVTR